MEHFETASEATREPLDRFALDLQQLREAKKTSYSDLAVQVSELRIARDLHEAAARTPRSTVYSCFRTGRARLDTDLLRDIVLALTCDGAEAERWVSRYLKARRQSEELRRKTAEASAPSPDEARVVPRTREVLPASKLSWGTVALVMLAAVLINRLGLAFNNGFEFSLFLDMVGTCFASIMLGPWYGVTVAAVSGGVGFLIAPDGGALFVFVNITGALVWGYGVRRFTMGADISRFMLLGVVTAVACSTVGVPINMFLVSIGNGQGLESTIQSLESMGLPFAAALFSANIAASLIDKLLAGFVGLVIFVYLHRRHGFPAAHMPLVEHLGTLRIAERPSVLSGLG